MSVLGVPGDREGFDGVATAGWLVTCTRCGEAEGSLECECCGEVLCPDCWGESDPFCKRCLGDDEEDARPVEIIDVGEGYL